MLVTVFHLDTDDASLSFRLSTEPEKHSAAIRDLIKTGTYRPVAKVEGDLEDAYRLTQNGVASPSWSREPPSGLTPLQTAVIHAGRAYGLRSSMVGDVFEIDGEYHVVAPVGFAPVA